MDIVLFVFPIRKGGIFIPHNLNNWSTHALGFPHIPSLCNFHCLSSALPTACCDSVYIDEKTFKTALLGFIFTQNVFEEREEENSLGKKI